MREASRDLRLPRESAEGVRVLAVTRRDDLERHLAAEARVPRPVDLAHATGPERGEDLIGSEAGSGRDRQPPAPSHLVNHSTIAIVERIRLGSFWKPWPSSGKSTYSTGMPRFFRLATTCSASMTGTFVSFAP